ncbi:HAD-like domain containing protein [Amanita muscaria]
MAEKLPAIRMVTFNALHTIITPRYPIHVQYSNVFRPYLGIFALSRSRESARIAHVSALQSLQVERPAYAHGSKKWWADVIQRTALEAEADADRLRESLPEIVPQLMTLFSTKEGYKPFDNAIPACHYVNPATRPHAIITAIVSNADSRIRSVLEDLDFPSAMDTIVLSEEQGIEKPEREIFLRTIDNVNRKIPSGQKSIDPAECLHVGDELICFAGGQAHKEAHESLDGIRVVEGLDDVIRLVESYNRNS